MRLSTETVRRQRSPDKWMWNREVRSAALSARFLRLLGAPDSCRWWYVQWLSRPAYAALAQQAGWGNAPRQRNRPRACRAISSVCSKAASFNRLLRLHGPTLASQAGKLPCPCCRPGLAGTLRSGSSGPSDDQFRTKDDIVACSPALQRGEHQRRGMRPHFVERDMDSRHRR